MSEPVFSIALVARNEARNLPLLFASLAEYSARGGEITIVDTGSDDDTISSARKLGARVVEMPGKFDLFLTAPQAARIEETFACNGETLELKLVSALFTWETRAISRPLKPRTISFSCPMPATNCWLWMSIG